MTRLRAIGYPRVSGESQGHSGYSLGDQVKAIEEFAERNNIELVAHYMEIESGSTIHKRPGFKAALKHCYHDAGIDCIIFSNLDRYSRDSLGAELIRRSMKARGKKLISVQESYLTPVRGYDNGGSGEEDDYLEAAIQHRMVEAEQERKRIVRRCQRGKDKKIAGGGWGGHRPPYECDVIQGELVLNPDRARIIRHIVRLRKLRNFDGSHVFSLQAIADYLNGKNNLIDPITGQVGRKFPRYFDRQLVRKRIKPRLQLNLWNREGIRKIVHDSEIGERAKWLRYKRIDEAS